MAISIVHVSIKLTQGNHAELRIFGSVASDYGTGRSVPLDDVRDLVGKAESGYYTPLPEDFLKLGRRLYEWMDGDDRVLSRAITQIQPEVIAISAVEALAHLPWELLADGEGFLVSRGMVPVRWVSGGRECIEAVSEPKWDKLKLMLMATDPAGSASLDYEREEGRILEATARAGLELVVEESGCLEELALLVRDYGTEYFDAFHLTGHAMSEGTEPKFCMESQTGELVLAGAREIARSFGGLPPLVFLSGCQTGKLGEQGAIASMAAQLVMAGAQAVMGWGETVDDREAALAAEIFYGEVAAGLRVDRALAKTYDRLMNDKRDYAVRDWHKLRLYVSDRLPGELVVPLRLRKKKAARVRLAESEFLDGAGLVKVASRSTFVGRRRILQRVLRVLQDDEFVGVMLHGLGGNGKSSVAARVCDRLAMSSVLKYKRVVIFGAIDEAGFVNAFSRELVREPECVKVLGEAGDLRSRLVRVLEMTTENWLFVMDDFEALSGGMSLNLDERNGSYVMKPAVAEVISPLCDALWESGGRLLVTSRYEVAGLARVVRVPLGAMDDREMIKKRRQLNYVAKIAAAMEPEKSAMAALQVQAETLADGNPRLLMWLDRVLCEVVDPTEILAALEGEAIAFREDVLAEKLLALLSRKEREALARGLVFELAVPRNVFESVVEFREFAQSIALGLLAVSPDGSVRVPRLLGLEVPQDEALAATAAKAIYEVWGKSESEIECLEMHRLAISGKVGAIAADIGDYLAKSWTNKNRYGESIEICKRTLAVTENFRVRHSLAHAQESLGLRSQSLQNYEKALQDCPDFDDSIVLKEKAAILNHLSRVYESQGKDEGAIKLYEESLQIRRAIGDQQGIADSLYRIAHFYLHQGDVERAISLYKEVLRIAGENGDQHGIATILGDIANVYVNQGNGEGAIKLYEESLQIRRAIGNQKGITASLCCIANVYRNQGDVEGAISLYKEVLRIERAIGDQQGIGYTLTVIASIYRKQGNIEGLIALYEEWLPPPYAKSPRYK